MRRLRCFHPLSSPPLLIFVVVIQRSWESSPRHPSSPSRVLLISLIHLLLRFQPRLQRLFHVKLFLLLFSNHPVLFVLIQMRHDFVIAFHVIHQVFAVFVFVVLVEVVCVVLFVLVFIRDLCHHEFLFHSSFLVLFCVGVVVVVVVVVVIIIIRVFFPERVVVVVRTHLSLSSCNQTKHSIEEDRLKSKSASSTFSLSLR
mmetsp:Transcript_453/g.1612  ORF Transcript_453/g.1612 Transcript_453/m.1612 type:complete len:200 (+) Transcript_453:2416-3015(+)